MKPDKMATLEFDATPCDHARPCSTKCTAAGLMRSQLHLRNSIALFLLPMHKADACMHAVRTPAVTSMFQMILDTFDV